MNIEEIFENGVTPKTGENAGKKFDVIRIESDGVIVRDEKGMAVKFAEGSYDLWHEPKTVFDDTTATVTWGNLKDAMAKAGLGDDTRFLIYHGGFFRSIEDAAACVRKVKGKDCVIMY